MMKGNLLIVDDEVLLVKRLKMDLESIADQVFVAYNGEEALQIISQQEIHCVTCDINMPRLNGVELLKRLRTQGNKVPFIFFTGHGSTELMLEAAKYGAFDFLDKPLYEGLEEVISRGLELGVKGPREDSESTDQIMSEYRKLLKSIDGSNS